MQQRFVKLYIFFSWLNSSVANGLFGALGQGINVLISSQRFCNGNEHMHAGNTC